MSNTIVKTSTVELWRRLLDSDRTSVVEMVRGYYGSFTSDVRPPTPTDEDIVQTIADNGDCGEGNWYEITLASCSEYGGSDLDRANIRTLEGMSGVDTYEDHGAWGESRAWIILGSRPMDSDEEMWRDELEQIVFAIESLDGYPLLDGSDHSELEMELAEEAWDSWLWSDVSSEIDQLLEDRWAEDWQDAPCALDFEPQIREAYYGYDNNWWSCESANSAVNDHHKEAMEHVIATVFPISEFPQH